MPDELAEAIQAAKEIAVARCLGCGAQRLAASLKVDIPDQADNHTCHGDRAAFKRALLAALETQPHLHEYEHVNSPCDPSAIMEVGSGCPRCCCEAEIRELLPDAKEESDAT